MNLTVGIISVLIALYFIYRTVMLWPPGRYRPRMTRPSTRSDIAAGLFVVITMLFSGIAILSGLSVVWALVGVAGGILWALANA